MTKCLAECTRLTMNTDRQIGCSWN